MTIKIAVFGSGGVGGYFGGRLAQAGEEVVFIARGEHLDAIRAHGLRVDSVAGDFVVHSAVASASPVEIGPVDVVLVAVKAWQVAEAAHAIRPMVGPETLVVPLQNGVEAPDQLAKVLDIKHVVGGTCGLMSFVAAPGHIRHAGVDAYVKFGELDNRRTPRVEELFTAFTRTRGVHAEVPDDILAAMWRKFLLIVSWSGMGSITRAPLGTILSLGQTRQMFEGIMREAFDVAQAQGIALPSDTVEEVLAFVEGFPPAATASMQRDVMEGRPSELESQTGAVVRLGRDAGVATPLNAAIYNSLLPLELKARGMLAF